MNKSMLFAIRKAEINREPSPILRNKNQGKKSEIRPAVNNRKAR